MPAIIVTGSQPERKNYINSLIDQHKLASYSIKRLEDKIKIAHVHEIIRSTKVKTGHNEKRLVIFEGVITIPAQNALLKFLEELQESDFIIFSQDNKDELVDTIISRCKIVSLKIDFNVQYSDNFINYDVNQLGEDKLMELATDVSDLQTYENLMLSIRENLLRLASSQKKEDLRGKVYILKTLHERYQLVKENNVNPKLTVETLALSK